MGKRLSVAIIEGIKGIGKVPEYETEWKVKGWDREDKEGQANY